MIASLLSFFYRCCLPLVAGRDAEKIHHLFIRGLGWLGRASRRPLVRRLSCRLLDSSPREAHGGLRCFGLHFRHPVGLAAGLDKNGEALEGLQLLGFSFLEIGTVTPEAQPGNPLPRLFRDYSQRTLFNAMGFNNFGIESLKRHLSDSRPHLRDDLIVGINIGKNASTPLEEAAADYRRCARELKYDAHYLAVNVSSPNTKGLRGLQHVDALAPILDAVTSESEKGRAVPVLVKLAPELNEEFLAELITRLEKDFPIAGWILTNTLQRPTPFAMSSMPMGGLSGAPLTEASRESLRLVRKYSQKVLVSSGGILSAEEAARRLELGASLVQIYSGLIFRGPQIVGDIVKRLEGKGSP